MFGSEASLRSPVGVRISTKVGCVLVKGKKVVSLGYNGLPMGVEDTFERLNNRELKYEMTVHAEINASLLHSTVSALVELQIRHFPSMQSLCCCTY